VDPRVKSVPGVEFVQVAPPSGLLKREVLLLLNAAPPTTTKFALVGLTPTAMSYQHWPVVELLLQKFGVLESLVQFAPPSLVLKKPSKVLEVVEESAIAA
jgi:hypothetical protein